MQRAATLQNIFMIIFYMALQSRVLTFMKMRDVANNCCSRSVGISSSCGISSNSKPFEALILGIFFFFLNRKFFKKLPLKIDYFRQIAVVMLNDMYKEIMFIYM